MVATALRDVKTAEQAREIAIDWQIWAGDQSLSYGELAEFQHYFETLGRKFDLTDEYKDNGIVESYFEDTPEQEEE